MRREGEREGGREGEFTLPSTGFDELEEISTPGPELPFAELHNVGEDREEGGRKDSLRQGDGGEERGLRVDLGDEEVIDVKELGKLFHGQVLLDRAVVPFARRFRPFRSIRLPDVQVALGG